MRLRIVAGSAQPDLAGRVAKVLGVEPLGCDLARFHDGELRPAVGAGPGDDVYVVQTTGRAVSEHIVELLLLLDGCRRAGAERVTAVVPYFAYARQDRRSRPGEAVGARVLADAVVSAGAERLVVVDPHTPTLEAMCAVPMEIVSAVPMLADRLAPVPEGSVVVAPDLGAVKLAERYAARLGLSVAVVRKTRRSGSEVFAEDLIGDVEGRHAIVVDDMVSTGGTIEAAARLLTERGAQPGIAVVVTHGLLVGPAADRLRDLPLHRLVVTDSVVASDSYPVEICSLDTALADAIRRLHGCSSSSDAAAADN